MDQDTQRQVENFAIMCPLKHIEDADMLAFLGTLIQDHDHLREKLVTEPDRSKWNDKIEAMRGTLRFKPLAATAYIAAEAATQCGVQPIYQEQEEQSRIIMPHSRIHQC